MPAVSLTLEFKNLLTDTAVAAPRGTAVFGSQLNGVGNVPAFVAIVDRAKSGHVRSNASRSNDTSAFREAELRRYTTAQLSSWPPADPHWIDVATANLVVKPGESVGTTETQVLPPPIETSSDEAKSSGHRASSNSQRMGLSGRTAAGVPRQKRALRHSGPVREFDESGPVGADGTGLKKLDCQSDLLSSRRAKGGSNKAVMIEVRESQSKVTYRVKDARVPAWWLSQFEPELASSMNLRSNFYPAMEVTMAQVFKSSGLDAPLMRLGTGCNSIIHPNATESSSNDLYAMSKFDDNYVDLGKFLTGEDGRSQILSQFTPDTEQCREMQRQHQNIVNKYHSARKAQKDLLAGRQYYELNGQRDSALINRYRKLDRERFRALEQLNQMLPDNLLREQEQHYLMSRLIGNWDHLNFRMDNFGYTRANDGWRGKTIDFDVTGPLGYMGVPKSKGHRIANVQRPPALFELKHITGTYDDFSQGHSPDLIGLDEQPYGVQSATSMQRIREAVERSEFYDDKKCRLYSDPRYRAVLEFGYRLTKLSDDTIKLIVLNNWENGPREFDLDPDRLSDILKMRRDSMLEQIGLTWIEKWRAEFPMHGERVDLQVQRAMSELGIR